MSLKLAFHGFFRHISLCVDYNKCKEHSLYNLLSKQSDLCISHTLCIGLEELRYVPKHHFFDRNSVVLAHHNRFEYQENNSTVLWPVLLVLISVPPVYNISAFTVTWAIALNAITNKVASINDFTVFVIYLFNFK